MKLLLGITGSVAAIKTPKLVRALATSLTTEPGQLHIIATKRSFRFWKPDDVAAQFAERANAAAWTPHIWRDGDEWPTTQYARGQKIPHIELATWADILVIAPLTANSLAQLAAGMCHNLLASTLRAWHRDRPIVVAPAMNTQMWTHPATAEHLATLQRWYPKFTVIDPVKKQLACGVFDVGGMADVETIVRAVAAAQFPVPATARDAAVDRVA